MARPLCEFVGGKFVIQSRKTTTDTTADLADANFYVAWVDFTNPLSPPAGCHFHTRCPHADERCRTESPPLEAAGDGTALACWHWRRIGPAPMSIARPAEAGNEALARLQAAFVR